MTRRAHWPSALLLGAAAFLVYLRTLAPSIWWGDSPELTAAAYNGGVAHPPGYPLYMLLGHLFTRYLPFGSPAYRMNLLSALCAAAAVGVVYLLLVRITKHRIAAATGALLFAFGQTFWSQAVIAEVYALHLLAIAAVLLLVLRWDQSGDRRWLFGAALAYGVAFAHHLQAVLIAPALLYFVLTSRHSGIRAFRRSGVQAPEGKRPGVLAQLPLLSGLFVVPLALYAYLPWAALRDAPQNWNDPRNWHSFLWHVTGREYRSFMFTKSPAELWDSFVRYAGITGEGGLLTEQYGLPALAVALVGAVSLARGNRRVFLTTLALYGTGVFYALNYKIWDIEAYYLIPHLVVALWAACGARLLAVRGTRWWRRKAAGGSALLPRAFQPALLGLPLLVLLGNWEANDRREDWSALRYARTALASLKPDAVVVGAGDLAFFPLYYVHDVEGRRPDVTLTRLSDFQYPHRLRLLERLEAGSTLRGLDEAARRSMDAPSGENQVLARFVGDNLDRGPVYLVADPAVVHRIEMLRDLDRRYYRTARSNFFTFELSRTAPAGVETARLNELRQPLRFASATGGESRIELAGHSVEPIIRDGARWLRLRYRWRLPAGSAPDGLRILTQLADPEGRYDPPRSGPRFRSDHPLGLTVGPKPMALPAELTETFDVLYPEDQSGRKLHLWVAVSTGEELLLPSGSRSRFVSLGELPSLEAGERLAER